MNWENKETVLKGNFAEDIVHLFLEDRGYIVYEPKTNGAHGFDRLAVKNKEQFIIAEVKAKARMKKYRATGVDVRHYNQYKYARDKHNIPVFIFFVDEWLGEIYGNWLKILERKSFHDIDYPNTKISKGIILFSYDEMIHVKDLTECQIKFLKEHSTRNYTYE